MPPGSPAGTKRLLWSLNRCTLKVSKLQGKLPAYSEKFDPYFNGSYDFEEDTAHVALDIAGVKGAAATLYAEGFSGDPSGVPFDPGVLSPEVESLLEIIFPGKKFDSHHVNALIAMGLLTKEGGDVSLTEQGVLFVTANQRVADDPDVPAYPAAMGLCVYEPEDIEKAKMASNFFTGNQFAEGKGSGDVIDLARDLMKGMMDASTELPSNTSMDAETRATLDKLFGGSFDSAEQLVVARDMGLINWDPATGVIELTVNGVTFAKDVGILDGSDPASGAEPSSPEATSGGYNAQQQAHIADAKAIDAAPVGSADRFTMDELMKMGFHPWMADWLVRNCSANGSDISLDALKSLDAAGYFDLYQGQTGGLLGKGSMVPSGEYYVVFEGLSPGSAGGDYMNCSFINLVMADPYWSSPEGQGKGVRRDLLENFVHHTHKFPDMVKEWDLDPDKRIIGDSRDYREFLDYWYAHMDGPDGET